jgi:hypothetical protein
MVPETSVIFSQPARLKFREDFVKFSLCEIFGSCITDTSAIELCSQHKGSDKDYTYIATFATK